MKIRVINENDWEKVYELDKSIVRIGSQVSCDVQLRDQNIQPLEMQIVRSGDSDINYVARFFADNIMLTRGDQTFPVTQVTPYDILDGDKILIGSYRLILSFEDERTRVRTSPHMSAELFLTKRELALESSINGMLLLKNLGTEKPCQFRMRMTGIPDDCFQSAPLPLLYPGSSSTVGFIITHLRVRPAPGFHTLSIVVTAPDDYFGETLEFNQDIYVHAVFDNKFVLEDDSQRLSGFNADQAKKAGDDALKIPEISIPDTRRLNVDADMITEEKHVETPVRIIGSDDAANSELFKDNEEENVTTYTSSRKKAPMVVVHNNDENAFGDDAEDSKPGSSDKNKSSADVIPPKHKIAYTLDDEEKTTAKPEVSAESDETSESEEAPVVKKKRRRKSEQFVLNEDTVMVPSDENESAEKTEEKPDVPAEPDKNDPEMNDPAPVKKSGRRKRADVTAEKPDEKPSSESVELQNNEIKPEKPDILIIKNSPEEIFGPDTEAGIKNPSETEAVQFVSETGKTDENQESENLPHISVKEAGEVDGRELSVKPEPENKDDDIQEEKPEPIIIKNEPMPGNADLLFENEQTDSSTDVRDGVQEAEPEAAVSAQFREDDGFDIPSSDSSEMKPSETADKGKPAKKKAAKQQFVNSKAADGNTPVAVVSGAGSFDESAMDPSDDRREPQNDSKPEVIVMKGGGFDE